MTDRYERIRQALEGLRERCAQEVERITGRRRAVAAMINNEAVKPCEVAVAIRKIDVQQYYECALREIERDEDLLRQALEALKDIRSRSAMDLVIGPKTYELIALLAEIHHIADTALAKEKDNEQ